MGMDIGVYSEVERDVTARDVCVAGRRYFQRRQNATPQNLAGQSKSRIILMPFRADSSAQYIALVSYKAPAEPTLFQKH